MLAKKTSKNQVTIPKAVIEHFEEVEYFDVQHQDNKIILSPVQLNTPNKDSLWTVRKKLKKLGLTQKDINEAIRWARKGS